MAQEMNTPRLGSIPIDVEGAVVGDNGRPIAAAHIESATTIAFGPIVQNLLTMKEPEENINVTTPLMVKDR